MLDLKFAYLLGCFYFLAIWLFLFWRLKKHRKLMILASIVFTPLGMIFEYILWIKDWWHPLTITGTKIGIEDFLLSFTHVTLPTTLYIYVFEKNIQEFDFSKRNILKGFKNLILIVPFSLLTTLVIFYVLKFNSPFSTLIGLLLGSIYIFLGRKDLILHSILAGLLLVLVVFSCFWLGISIYPDIINEFWCVGKISNILVLGVPIEDLLFYLGVGMFLGIMYPYLFEFKITDSVETNSLKKDLKKLFLFLKSKLN